MPSQNNPTNPYIAGSPVGGGPAFVGRDDVLREVLRVLRQPQANAIVLYGQRRIGKTSMLRQLLARLPQEGPFCPVYVDLQDKSEWPLGRVLQDVARVVARALDQPAPDLGAAPESAFRETWLPAALAALPAGCSLVLLLDEFDVLADPERKEAARAFFSYLSNLLSSDPQRLQFVFVIGRNVDDLDSIALAVFKGAPARRVSLFSREDAARLTRLAEANGSLRWSDGAVQRVWQLACGHPYLTQQLCWFVWERAYDEEPDAPPTVAPDDVDAAVDDALDAARNALEWLWNGLPAAARVIAAALAEAGPAALSQDELERRLREGGVRVVIRELQNAPQLLQGWDIVEADGDSSAAGAYRFRVELLRRWIALYKPLSRVQEELERIEPVADNLYRAAVGLYQSEQFEQAVELLQRTVQINPNHTNANLLLADLLLAQDQAREAQQILERLVEYQPAAARSRLVDILLTQAREVSGEDEKLGLYERVLALSPEQPQAAAGRRQIWQARGDAALAAQNWDAAIRAYQNAGDADKVKTVETQKRRQELQEYARNGETALAAEDWETAVRVYQWLTDQDADDARWPEALKRVQREQKLAARYAQGTQAVQQAQWKAAWRPLAEVIYARPDYKEAAALLACAVEQQRQIEQQEAEAARAAAVQEAAARKPTPAAPQAEPPTQQDTAEEPAAGQRRVFEGIEMVYVPGGPFTMGSNDYENEKPVHTVTLDGFWIGRFPVTNAEYLRFVQATGHPAPKHWQQSEGGILGLFSGKKKEISIPEGKEKHPVVYVSWRDALAYCQWLAQVTGQPFALPTEAQWEKAARGPLTGSGAGRTYPWGNDPPDKTRCNFNNLFRGTTPVGQFSPQGDSPYGCADMAGNVWEWVADWYDAGYYASSPAQNPLGPVGGTARVLRGGSWDGSWYLVRPANRHWDDDSYSSVNVGFRCVRSGSEP